MPDRLDRKEVYVQYVFVTIKQDEFCEDGGNYWTRTSGIHLVRVALYQLS